MLLLISHQEFGAGYPGGGFIRSGRRRGSKPRRPAPNAPFTIAPPSHRLSRNKPGKHQTDACRLTGTHRHLLNRAEISTGHASQHKSGVLVRRMLMVRRFYEHPVMLTRPGHAARPYPAFSSLLSSLLVLTARDIYLREL